MRVNKYAPQKFHEMRRWGQYDVIDLNEVKRRAMLYRKYRRWRREFMDAQ